jgi:hypothetical protein
MMLSRRMPSVTELVDKNTLVVRAAMIHLPQHLPHDVLRRLRIRAADYSTDSTHGWLFRSIREGAPSSVINESPRLDASPIATIAEN